LLRAQLHNNAPAPVLRSVVARLWQLDPSLKHRHEQLQTVDPPLINNRLLDITKAPPLTPKNGKGDGGTKQQTLIVDDSSYRITGQLPLTLADGRTIIIYRLQAPLPVYLIPDFLTMEESDTLSNLLTTNINTIVQSHNSNNNNNNNDSDNISGHSSGPLLCFSRGGNRQHELASRGVRLDLKTDLFPVDEQGSVSCINQTRHHIATRSLTYHYSFSRSTLVYR
jgi:hypothetical protein